MECKVCACCKLSLEHRFFYKSSGRYSSACKDCTKRRALAWQKENKSRYETTSKAYYASNRSRLTELGRDSRERRKERNSSEPSRDGMKDCSGCRQSCPKSAFARQRDTSDGLSYYCVDCRRMQGINDRLPSSERISLEDWFARRCTFGFKCAYCQIDQDASIDHFMPLALDGRNTLTNLVPSCVACNNSKGRCNPYSWILTKFGPTHPMLSYNYLHEPRHVRVVDYFCRSPINCAAPTPSHFSNISPCFTTCSSPPTRSYHSSWHTLCIPMAQLLQPWHASRLTSLVTHGGYVVG